MPADVPALRASDHDRERVVTRLREAAGQGALGLDELEGRIVATYAATTLPELTHITADLPPSPRPSPPLHRRGLVRIPALRDPDFKGHLTIYLLVIGFLVGIWAMAGGGHFWPFYPAAGWGIGLGAHFMGATEDVKKRQRKQEQRDLEDQQRDRRQPQRRQIRDAGEDPHVSVPASGSAPGHDRRRFVVAMFVDVVGSTELNEALGDESWSRVRDRYRQLLAECFEAEDGWEANVAGDGVLGRFEHPAGAVRSGIEIQRRLDHERDEIGFAPTVRIGIHSGDVVDDGQDLIGSVVNVAARVTEAAGPSEIYVTEHVADHVPASVATEGQGLHTLKGIGRPRHLLAVCWR